MHLSLTLPSVWYEVHVVTPSINSYGVLIPGAPLPIAGFNSRVAWGFTNSGADQIDYYWLERDSSGTMYRYGHEWHARSSIVDTLRVHGREPIVDTLHYSHLGPLQDHEEGMLAVQWVGHLESRTSEALWQINQATSAQELERALESWDTPLQNVVFADVDGNIGLRLTGILPIRSGRPAAGLQQNGADSTAWTGRVPFGALPHVLNPDQEYLVTANQEPVGPEFPFYLGYDWREPYRAMRLNQLLSEGSQHSASDFKRYQSDVHVVQMDLLKPVLDTLSGLSDRADSLRSLLVGWDGGARVDSPEPLVLDELLLVLPGLVWDEPAFGPGAGLERVEDVRISGRQDGRSVTARPPIPSEALLLTLIRSDPHSKWFDRMGTERREDAGDILRLAFEITAETLDSRYGWDVDAWRWGDHHHVVFPHLTRDQSLRSWWRGPFETPGFAGTVSPAGDRLNAHGASWRMIVDLSTSPPEGFGIYPGGQSGNPFSRLYALHIPRYLKFGYNRLLTPGTPTDLGPDDRASVLVLYPKAGGQGRQILTSIAVGRP